MTYPRTYVVVIATQGGREAPAYDMQIVDAFDCVEAAKQLMLETAGRYGCDVSIVYCRPATVTCLRSAAEILAEEELRRMPACGMVA